MKPDEQIRVSQGFRRLVVVSFHAMLWLWVMSLFLPSLSGLNIAGNVAVRALMALHVLLVALFATKKRLRWPGPSYRALWAALALFGIARLVSIAGAAMPEYSLTNEARFLFVAAWAAAVPFLWPLMTAESRTRLLGAVVLVSNVLLSLAYLRLGVRGAAASKADLYASGFNTNVAAYVLLCFVLLWVSERRRIGRVGLLVSVAVMWSGVAVAVALSRSAYAMALGFAAAVSVLAIVRWTRNRPVIRAAMLLTVAGVVAAGAWALVASLSLSQNELNSVSSGRLVLWQSALDDMPGYRLLGHGGAAGDALAGRTFSSTVEVAYVGSTPVFSGGLHNAYLAAYYEYGAVGLACFVLLLYVSLRAAFRVYRVSGQGVLLATMIGLLFRQFFELQGLIGRSNAAADFVAFLLVAVIAERASELERVERMRSAPRVVTRGDAAFANEPWLETA